MIAVEELRSFVDHLSGNHARQVASAVRTVLTTDWRAREIAHMDLLDPGP